ncbi:GIY-YIG nuclease family protein [Microbacterium arabinogalactanolyticum]|uniref:GIY-YIG nuclease family protein n=1 Tax=Microbacterium arabinogalactanolyticum TaxID=69365 RepID=UPI00404464E6
MYALIDPRSRQARYVGQTANTLYLRLQDHLRRSQDRTGKARWLRELLAAGEEPQIVLLEEFTGNRQPAYAAESQWVQRLRSEGHPLLN